MQLPNLSGSTPTYLQFADHTEGSLEAWVDSPTLTSEQQSTLRTLCDALVIAASSLRSSSASSEDAQRSLRKTRARFGVCDTVLDLRVMNVSDSVLNGPALRSRKHPTFLQVFPTGTASSITKASRYDQPDDTQALMARLDSIEDFEGKSSVRTQLDEALQRSLSVRDALRSQESSATQLFDAERNARLKLRTLLEEIYGTIRTMFAGRKDFAESFFLKMERVGSPSGSAAGISTASTTSVGTTSSTAAPN